MAEYSRLEYYEMISTYFICGRDSHVAAEIYYEENRARNLPRYPDYRVF